MENMANAGWLQVGTLFVGMLGLGLAGLVYLTRQFNRLADRVGNLEQRQARLEERVDQRFDRVEERTDERFNRMEESIDERFNRMEERTDERFDRMEEDLSQLRDEVKNLGEGLQNVEKEQARMLGFLEGRGVMGKMPAPDAEAVS